MSCRRATSSSNIPARTAASRLTVIDVVGFHSSRANKRRANSSLQVTRGLRRSMRSRLACGEVSLTKLSTRTSSSGIALELFDRRRKLVRQIGVVAVEEGDQRGARTGDSGVARGIAAAVSTEFDDVHSRIVIAARDRDRGVGRTVVHDN